VSSEGLSGLIRSVYCANSAHRHSHIAPPILHLTAVVAGGLRGVAVVANDMCVVQATDSRIACAAWSRVFRSIRGLSG
jgi:hypothetical protein